MWLPSTSASVIITTLWYLSFSKLQLFGSSSESPKPAPIAVIMDCISLFDKSLSSLAFSELITFPLRGRIACILLSLPCFAVPPAESPSTRKSSHWRGSLFEQSASFPGRDHIYYFFLTNSLAFFAAILALAASAAFSIILFPIDGFCSKNACIPS